MSRRTRRPAWLVFGLVAIIAVAAAALLVITRAPLPEVQGTAPSVITDTVGGEAQPLSSDGAKKEGPAQDRAQTQEPSVR
jgi:hypothetical protein